MENRKIMLDMMWVFSREWVRRLYSAFKLCEKVTVVGFSNVLQKLALDWNPQGYPPLAER